MHKVFLGIGGNIGNKDENFRKIYSLATEKLGTVVQSSSIYESPPWGFRAEENFWNQILIIETGYSPESLLKEIHIIENEFGRKRKKNAYVSREMDIDILYYAEHYIETEKLIIPHPRIHQRLFVLVPLSEIAPHFKHPLFRLTNMQMLENCKDTSIIKKVNID